MRLFPEWSDTAFRFTLAGAGGGIVLLLVGLWVYVRTPYNTGQFAFVDQPVQFDHRHHVRDDGIDCRYCHTTVEREASAGYPATELCAGCHNQVWNQSPMLEPIRRSYFSNTPIPWNRVHNLPDYVYFNHSIHVNKGVGCVSCHGRVDEMPLIEQEKPLQMGWCLDCHRDPAPNLRPRDQVTNMEWTPKGDPAEEGEKLATEYGVRKLTNCTTCHR